MAQKLYDLGFQGGTSGFKGVAGTFLSERLKHNTQKLQRELKAADPTREYDRLRDLQKDLNDAYSNLSRLKASPTGGGSTSFTSTDPGMKDMLDYMDRVEKVNQKRGFEFEQGVNTTGVIKDELESVLERDWAEGEMETRVINLLKDRGLTSARERDIKAGLAAGMSEVVSQSAEKGSIDKNTANNIINMLRTESGVTDDDLKAFDDPQYLSEGQRERLPGYLQGSTRTTTVRKQMGEGVDASQLAAIEIQRIKDLKAQIEEQKGVYAAARENYQRIASGQGRNLALEPISSRPSALSETLGLYSDVMDRDPRYAREILDESVRAQEFTVPERFANLRGDPASAGVSPVDILLQNADNISMLRGSGAVDGQTVRDLEIEDVDLVKSSLKEMLDTVNSGMYSGMKYKTINQGGTDIEINDYLTGAIDFLDDIEPEYRAELASEISDEISNWRKSLDEGSIMAAREESQPGYAVARSAGKLLDLKKEYDVTKDPEPLFKGMSAVKNELQTTVPDARSAYGNELLMMLEGATEKPISDSDIQLYESQWSDLKDVANESGAMGVLDGRV